MLLKIELSSKYDTGLLQCTLISKQGAVVSAERTRCCIIYLKTAFNSVAKDFKS